MTSLFLAKAGRTIALSLLACGLAAAMAFELYLAWLPPLPEFASTAAAPPSLAEEPSEDLTIPDRFDRGDTLSSVLARNGFDGVEIHEMGRALSAVMNVRRLRQGDELEIRFDDGEVATVLIQCGDLTRVLLVRSDAGWQSERTAVDVERRTVAVAGRLEDNLFFSMSKLGEAPPLTVAFAGVFSWDFDFHTQSRRGDRFSLIVEKLYREGEFVGYGDLHAARYLSRGDGPGDEQVLSAFLYQDPNGRRDYYDTEGKSLRKAFLRSPVAFERISSGFSYSRLHPIHGRRMPHLGVDYAARTGTPVYAVAAGVVVDRGYRGGGGNTVTVRHQMGYTSKYLHLSRFAKGLRAGSRVEQKEVIGYVGSTGAATGAHLDFRLLRHGKPVNPLTQIFPPGPPVPAEFRADFDSKKAALEGRLPSIDPTGALPTTDD
jgi:murein DD-endopeptidase MepM/ murein hydrolase activator NlpD